MNLLEQGHDTQLMESHVCLSGQWPYRHECGRHMGRVSPELSGAETEHPSRAGASLQGSAALCSLYWGRNLLLLSFSHRLVNH